MTTNETEIPGAAEYAAGYAAGQRAIATLSGGILDDAQMYEASVKCIIPVHVRDASLYDQGCSQAWADWQSARRVARRRTFRGAR